MAYTTIYIYMFNISFNNQEVFLKSIYPYNRKVYIYKVYTYIMKTKTDQIVKEDKARSGVEPKILSYFHCGKCLNDLSEESITDFRGRSVDFDPSVSPVRYSKLSVGATEEGIQIWCDRHDCEVGHIRLKEVK